MSSIDNTHQHSIKVKSAKLNYALTALFRFTILIFLVYLFSHALFFTVNGVHAESVETNNSTATNSYRKTPRLNKFSHKILIKAQELLDKKLYAEALNELDKLIKGSRTTDYAKALALKIKSRMYYQDNDYENAILSQRSILSLSKLPTDMETEAFKSLGQLYYVTGKYQLSIDYFERWIKQEKNQPAKTLALLAQAYYQVKNYKSSIKHIKKAIRIVERTQPVAEERWYLLLRSAYFDVGNNSAAAEVLQILSLHFPKRRYWLQLAGTYSELGRIDKQLSTLELAYISNQLSNERDFKNLAYLYLSENIPYKAAKVIQQGIEQGIVARTDKNLNLLSTAWSLAKEPSLALTALIEAATLSASGTYDLQLARLYFNQDNWTEAIKAVESARAKDSSNKNSDIDLLYAISLFNLDRLGDAQLAFKRLGQSEEEESRVISEQWLAYIELEIERKQTYAEALQESQDKFNNSAP